MYDGEVLGVLSTSTGNNNVNPGANDEWMGGWMQDWSEASAVGVGTVGAVAA
jgi:hypothetical protein